MLVHHEHGHFHSKAGKRTVQSSCNDALCVLVKRQQFNDRPFALLPCRIAPAVILVVVSLDYIYPAACLLAENLRQQANKIAAQKAAAEDKAKAFEGVALEIPAKVAVTGQLYGSVGAAQVVEALAQKGIEVDRKIVTMKEAKKVGEYEATVHFHKEVEVKVPVTVVAENAPVAAPVEEKKEEAPVVEEAPVAEAPAEEEAPAEA